MSNWTGAATIGRRTLVVVLVAGGLALAGSIRAAADSPPATTEPAGGPTLSLTKSLELFRKAQVDAGKARSGVDGYSVWEELLKNNLDPSVKAQAEAQLKIWKPRVDSRVVAAGPCPSAPWLPEAKVAQMNAKADELVAKADAATEVPEAAKLYNEAFQAHPYRPDIPFRKAVRFYKGQKLREASQAWGEVLKLDKDNVAALNNIGVLAAINTPTKLWSLALSNLTKAATLCDDDRVWDNLDGVIGAAAESGLPPGTIQAAEAGVNGTVRAQRLAGKHKAENRWGNKWISETEFQKLVKENKDADDAIVRINGTLAQIRNLLANQKGRLDLANRNLEKAKKATYGADEVKNRAIKEAQDKVAAIEADIKKSNYEGLVDKGDAKIKEWEGKKNVPTHADKYILLEADGKSELATQDVLKDEPKNGDAKVPAKGAGSDLFK